MRVISGQCRGRKLVPIQGIDIRPTSDRTKEAVFNILNLRVKKARVLDLFAGTGSLGIEALSRGADHVTFIDHSCDIIKKNVSLCGFENNVDIITSDISSQSYLSHIAGQEYDLIFIDPPYGKGYIDQVLNIPEFLPLLNAASIVIAEHSAKEKIQITTPELDMYRQKKYSKTMISFIRKLEKG